MAVKTFMVTTGLNDASGGLADGVDQTAASRTDGWTVAKLAAGNSGGYLVGSKRASTVFDLESTTPKPTSSVNTFSAAFRIPVALTGTFAATSWTLTFAFRATTASAQAGRVRMRVYRATTTNEIFGTEITASTQVGTTTAALSTTADVTSVVTWSPGAVTVAGEYLYFVLAWETTTAGGNNSADVLFRTGQSAGGSRIVTPDLGAGSNTYTKAGYGRESL